MKTYELMPTNGRKSFYGKATVEIDNEGVESLLSYGIRIVKRLANGKLVRLWDGWSATTGRHIAAFCGLSKKEFQQLPMES